MSQQAKLQAASTAYVRQIEEAQASFRANSAARGAVGQHISALSAQLASIEGALKKVQGISRQVTILATNAAIEAARAGVHGKGFSVVAQEVGSLAKNTDAAADEIETNMLEMKKLLQNTVQDMDRAKAIGGSFDEALNDCVEEARALGVLIAEEPQDA